MKKTLTFAILLFTFCIFLTACGNKCEHTYDNACDATCNDCGETREVSAHQWNDADCLNPKTCTVCGKTEGSALGHEWTTPDVDLCEVQSTCSRCGATDGENKEHTPAVDDGNCTTEVKCTVCGDVTTPAGQHTPNNDDGNCLTAITCSVCGTTTTPAKESHTGGTATCTEKAVCAVCNTAYGELDPTNHRDTETKIRYADENTHETYYECCNTVVETGTHNGEATCSSYGYCTICAMGYAEPDPTNHKSDETYTIGIDGEKHGVYYSCCQTLKEEVEHTVDRAATCNQRASCADCGNEFGEFNPENHAIPEARINYIDGEYHEERYICCNTVAKTEPHNGEASCMHVAYCTVCKQNYGNYDMTNHESDEFIYESAGPGAHTKLHACCRTVSVLTESCSGGEATCMAGAVCEKCDQTYAELDENAHAYEAAVYTWSPDYSTCKATIACSHNEAHSIVETAEAQYDETNDQLFATFENTDFEEVRINYPYTFSEVDGGYSIKKYRGTNKILHIPSTYNGSPIVSLDTQAFRDCDTLVEVVIPEGITVIGETCFYMLDNLKTVHIPASVTTISSEGFNRCYALTDVIFAENSMLTTIGDLAFSECESLVSIVLPKSALNLGSGLFSGCSALTSVVLPEGITALPNSIVSRCDSLVEFNIPTTVTAIGKNAFYYCTNLTVVGGISNVTSIGDGAFSYCSSLKEINLPNCLTSIGEEAFSGCSGLTSIKLPEGITEIKKSTFSYCDSLTEFTIPSTVTSIGNWAFYYCDSLTTITVPKGVTDIGFCAFHMCDNLVSINVEEENERYWSVDGILYGNDSGMVALIQCPNGKAGVVTVQEGTQRIDRFMYCEKITAIIIPDSVTWIQKEAFYACTFESITIPKSLETLGLRSLGQNENLKTVYYGGTTEEWNTLIAKVSTIGISESVVVICSDSESAAQ